PSFDPPRQGGIVMRTGLVRTSSLVCLVGWRGRRPSGFRREASIRPFSNWDASSVERKRTRSAYPRTEAVRLTGFSHRSRFPTMVGGGKRPSGCRLKALIRFVSTSSTYTRSSRMRNERGRSILLRSEIGSVSATQQPGHVAPGQPVVASVSSVVHTWRAREPALQTLGRCPLHSVGS